MIQFTAEVDGLETVSRAFNRVDQFISDFRNIWPAVIEEFYKIESEQFGSEGSQGASGHYAALSKPYERFKAIHFPGKPILQATGALKDSLTGPDALDSILRPEADQLTIGTGLPYAIWHQRGTGRMPSRPPIAMNEDSKRRLQKAIQIGLVKFTRQAGFQVDEERAA